MSVAARYFGNDPIEDMHRRGGNAQWKIASTVGALQARSRTQKAGSGVVARLPSSCAPKRLGQLSRGWLPSPNAETSVQKADFSDALAWMPQTGYELMRMPFQDVIPVHPVYTRLVIHVELAKSSASLKESSGPASDAQEAALREYGMAACIASW
ncbi:hypothetical protein K504DRAFT_503249 [Pleomassaria siparia CBS 279.74]|uniref:Uncharacterized protein n=1 Tax=Pleomassaria siparia CBS 279.74 TaxID=1314801 RepID=A0A6G1K619_9PLEO|nr:hypothetical protein K504DRAFT_503249 [Pleomassaria siparia CBS 279.74]